MVGAQLGPYRLTALLGEGGMGAVYRAEDPRLGREVAIKILPEAVAADAERLARFQREAQVVASLNHPNICALYDIGESADVHYLVMELVDGESLAERIGRGLDLDEGIGIAAQIANALEAAHARGIVHRDLKPANVMLTAEGVAKVLDFGLAKAREDPGTPGASLSNSPTLTRQMTQAGMILGTAGYMSPEQARGGETDQRADIWAWGVILHEMLTGKALFAEPTVSDTLAAVLRAEFDWSALPPDTPTAVRRVLRRCLERDAGNRLHSIADARIELTGPDVDDGEAGTAAAVVPPSRTPLLVAVAIGIAGLLLAAIGWWTRPAPAGLPLRVVEVGAGASVSHAAISPDGRRVVLRRAGKLAVRELDSMHERMLEGVDDVAELWSMFWSPDSRHIGYATAEELYTVPANGGAKQRVCEIPDSTRSDGTVLGGTWLGDDTLAFSLDSRGVLEVPAIGGEPRIFLVPDAEKQEAALHFPQMLPDDRTVMARVRWRDRPDDTITFLRDGVRTDVTYPGWGIDHAAYARSGHLVFTRRDREGGLWAAPFSLARLAATGDPVRLLPGYFAGLSIADDGTLVTAAISESRTRCAVIDREGNVIRFLEGLGYERDPAVSPGGKKVATWGIRVHDGERVVTVTPDWMTGPTWSPDGRELIFDGRGQGLLRIPADGSRPPVMLMEGDIDTPHWSPDGRRVIYTMWVDSDENASELDVALSRDERSDIMVLELDAGGEPRPFRASPASELYPRFSPDGRFVAYASDESGRFEVYVTDFPAGERRWAISTGGGRFPRWSRDGKEIYFVAGGHLMATDFTSAPEVRIGAPTRLISKHDRPLQFKHFGQATYDPMPDGNFVAMYFSVDTDNRALLIQNWPALLERAR